MEEQFISCKCITYGRVSTLEEALHGFLQQDYPKDKCELLIVNDYPKQKLVFDHPQVRIFNLDKTFDTIGAKENFATEQCKGDVIIQWDDDDVALPNHLQNVNKFFVEGTDLLQWNRAILMDFGKIKAITGVGNSGIVYSRRIWEKFGRYPLQNAGYDMTFVLGVRGITKNVVIASPPDDEVSWIYYWGGRCYHMSGQGTDKEGKPNVIIRHSEYIESQRKRGLIPTGTVLLRPQWKQDYTQTLKDYLNNKI